jgi:hypothetical protein
MPCGPLRAVPVMARTIRRPHLLNNPMISAFAKVLKCKLKPTTAADVSGITSSRSVFTAKTVNR